MPTLTTGSDTTTVSDGSVAGSGYATYTGQTFDALAGVDTLSINEFWSSSSTGHFTLKASSDGVITLTTASSGHHVFNFVNYEVLKFSNVTVNLGTSASETVTGTSVADGYLFGLAGDDTIDGKAGADTMYGGLGNDTYVIDNTADSAVENAGEGTDLVQSSKDYTLGTNVENLTLVSTASGGTAINGTGNASDNYLTGNENANTLSGAGGNDTLDGGAGTDTLIGGTGDDTYLLDSAAETVTEAAGEGIDTVQIGFTYTLAAEVEKLILTGVNAINGTGNGLANTITGNSAANTLDGGALADTLIGLGGADTYVVDNAGDIVDESAAGSGGADTVLSSVAFSLADAVHAKGTIENLTLTGGLAISGTGNGSANTLTGNTAANKLDGGALNDIMRGLGGADTYVVDNAGDVVDESAVGSAGIDMVLSSVTFSLADAVHAKGAVENLTLTGAGAIKGTGNAAANTIAGNAYANVLNGGLGNDILTGGAGKDTFQFTTALNAATNKDAITDFKVVDDTIAIDNAVFTKLVGAANTTLSAAQFYKGAAAHDADDRIIYNATTGALLYDADGNKAGAAVQFATVNKGLLITNADFMII